MDFKKLISFILLVVVTFSCQSDDQMQFFVMQGEAQGSTYSIKYCSTKEVVFKKSIDSLLTAFDMSVSTYRPDSKISKINDGDSTIVVDDFFVKTFTISNQIYKETNGLFDPTVGVLVNAYGFGPKKEKIALTPKKIDSLLNFVGFDKVRLNDDKTITKQHTETFFDFNAIAQGFSVDVVAEFLKSKGIEDGIVEIGGEIFAFGTNKVEQKKWIIGIDDPTQLPQERTIIAKINLENLGMATSGNYRKVKIDSLTGQKFVHIINPKTGLSERSAILSSTVLAPTCMEADGYATALMIMDLEAAKTFLKTKKQLAVLLIYTDKNNQVKQFTTQKFQSLILE